jgi:hypothetical protein
MSMLIIAASTGAILLGLFTIFAGAMVWRLSWARRGDKVAQAEAVRGSGWYPLIQISLMLTMVFLIAQNLAIAGERGSMGVLQGFALAVLGAGFGANLTALALTWTKRANDRKSGGLG